MSVKTPNTHKTTPKNRYGSLVALAKEQGIDPCELVMKTVLECGSIQGAATKFGFNGGTIRYWLKRAGKEVQRRSKLILVDTEG